MIRTDRRAAARRPSSDFGEVTLADGAPFVGCGIRELSELGASIALTMDRALPPRICLRIGASRVRVPARVIWQDGQRAGIRFGESVPQQSQQPMLRLVARDGEPTWQADAVRASTARQCLPVDEPEHLPVTDRFDLGMALCCPRCGGDIALGQAPRCLSVGCVYSVEGFPLASGQPVLIDFENSIFDRAAYADGRGSVIERDDMRKLWRTRVRDFMTGANPVSPAKCRELVDLLKAEIRRPAILIIGGGAVGIGTHNLYCDPDIDVIGTDVYASGLTRVLADGHRLPFRDGVFDGVWIQAVLEHVLEPQTVVNEIHRVLKPRGLVYADTPFMQQVHEGAYDFTRFTLSGHRWLFRRFEEIEAGPVGGPAVSFVWSLRYLIRSLGLGNQIATAVGLALTWLRFIDRFTRKGLRADAANGVYFFGMKSGRSLTAKDMPGYFERHR